MRHRARWPLRWHRPSLTVSLHAVGPTCARIVCHARRSAFGRGLRSQSNVRVMLRGCIRLAQSNMVTGAMKRLFLGTVTLGTLVVGGQAALGADVSATTSFNPDVGVPTLFNYWNGAYVGLHGGWGWTTTRGLNASGDLGGGQAGYNYQMGNLVFGVEGDGDFANISQNITNLAIGIPGSFGYKEDGLASLRGRFGIAFNNLLFYGTAGGGWGHDRITALGASASRGTQGGQPVAVSNTDFYQTGL